MGKSDFKASRHQQQSQILVPLDTPHVKIERMLLVFGYDDAPLGHGQVLLENVRVPTSNLLLGEGRALKLRKVGSVQAAFITACARSARLKRRWRRCSSGSIRASRPPT